MLVCSETLAASSNTDEDSFNLSSTTDAALGDLRPTYTNNFSNANYEALGVITVLQMML